MNAIRLGVLATHPIQYHAPLYRELAATDGIDLTVFFCHRPTPKEQGIGFGVEFEWDVDLTSGYRHVWLENVARSPSVGRFGGCNTPGVAKWIGGRPSSGDAGGPVGPGTRFDAFVVHGWAWRSCWQAFRACWRTRTPLVVRGDSQLPQGPMTWRTRAKQMVKRVLYPSMMRRFDLCLAYGQRSAEYFRHYGAPRVAIAPHFVDNGFFAGRAAELRTTRTALRRRWGIPDAAFCLLLCGKLAPVKRPLDLLAALRALPERGDDSRPVHLLVVGDGELRKQCEEFVCEHRLPVTFAGFLNQSAICGAYAAGDALVLCSLSETWGLVVNEAMASGLPAIVSRSCGCAPDLVDEGVTGLVFPQGDVAALSHCIERLRGSQAGFSAQAIREGVVRNSAQAAAEALLGGLRPVLHDLNRRGSEARG